jgi:hypothetical protein
MLNIDKTIDNLLEVTVGDHDGDIQERRNELKNDIICAFEGEEEVIVNLDMDNDCMDGIVKAYENFYEAPNFFLYIEEGQVVNVSVR